ncbi:hypothetical protein [Kitasatospora phosalacinea]|uniref:hypothetical protein n=1 Tax=Kitasatospora phosalacinea TaxID=2065 RepID=UPI0005266681|nr:hypothetical protein [Kitasatospora phosalacinea]
MLRTSPARLLAITLSSACALVLTVPAGAEDTEPVTVPNGTFASPAVPPDKTHVTGADGWSGALVMSAAWADHPRGYQGGLLALAGSTEPLSTRLPNVRTGATVTLGWDDSPNSCVSSGGGRPYTVKVAGPANAPGSFTTNVPTGKTNWYLGRTYSFTAAEDRPQVTFIFDGATASPTCRPMITDVRAKQTAPPLTPPKGGSDPCEGDAANTPECKDLGDAEGEIDKCPATSRECLGSVAGDGKQTNDGIDQQTTAVKDFGDIPREESPEAAAQDLCPLSNALTEGVPPEYMVVPPSQWGQC